MVKIICTCFVLLFGSVAAEAATLTMPVLAGGRGYITADGVNNGPSAAADFRVGQDAIDGAPPVEFRNYFLFDIPGFMGQLTAARLLLQASPNSYSSADASEMYTLSGLPIVFGFDEIGAGTVYGSRSVSAADNGSVVTFTLNSAGLAAIMPASPFQLGGTLTSLNGGNPEALFRFSEGNTSILELDIVSIPEPSTFLLLLGGMGAMALRSSRLRWKATKRG